MKAWRFALLTVCSVCSLAAAPRIVPVPERVEVDLAALARNNPFLHYKNGLQLAAGRAVDLDRALLYLNFDEPAAPLLKDRRGLYRVIESQYSPSEVAHSGDRSAFFRRRSQNIRLRTTEALWPLKHEQAFTISFWMRPRHFFRSSNLFRRIGYASGERKGIEILLEQNRLRLNLEGILRYNGDVGAPLSLRVKRPLKKGHWYHVAVSFDRARSTVVLFLDGREEGRLRFDRNGILPEVDFSGPELAPIQLGGDFIGHMDELMILNRAVSEESELDTSPYGRLQYNHRSGRGRLPVVSEATGVYQLLPATESITIRASGSARNGSSLRLYYRLSDVPFSANRKDLAWKQFADFASGQDVQKVVHLPARYIQLKGEWQPDPSGSTGPVLHSLAIEQHVVDPPMKPTGVRIIEELSRDGRICLEWRINPEIEIEERGGYIIHIGVRPGEYEAVLTKAFSSDNLIRIRQKNLKDFPLTPEEKKREELRPEQIREWKRSHIRVFLDNRLLSHARFVQNIHRPLPYFENNHPYYFAVSAFINEKAPSRISDPVWSIYRE